MNYQAVQNWKIANPFQPFRLVTADGRHFDIRHPNLVWPGASTVLIGIQDPTQPAGVFGHYTSVAMPNVARLDALDVTA
jgi:hypothetical protein